MSKRKLLIQSQLVSIQQAVADCQRLAERCKKAAEDGELEDLARIQNSYNHQAMNVEKRVKDVLQKSNRNDDDSLKNDINRSKSFLEKINQEYDKEIKNIRNSFEISLQEVNRDMETMAKSVRYSGVEWDHPSWKDYQPVDHGVIPCATRIGVLRAITTYNNEVLFPALLPVIGSRNVVIKVSGAAKEKAIGALQSITLRLFLTLPPGKIRFLMIDPVGRGANMSAFLNLRDEVRKKIVIGDRIWTEANHIEQRLADLTAHVETVIQQYLTNKYATMEAYNEAVGGVSEAYRLLCIANFPANFTETSARRLISIAVNGSKTGVYVLVMVDTEQPLPHGFSHTDLEELERVATVIEHTGNGFMWKEDVLSKAILELESPPPREQFNSFVEKVGAATETAFKVEIPFSKVMPTREEWWQGNASAGLQVPIGMQGTKKLLFDLGKGTAHHALVVGKPGSGKSNLLHSLIMNLTFTYSPDELALYLIDFKKGVEFRDYAYYQLPHARVVAIQSEREFGLSVLRELDRELQERGDRFTNVGVNNLQLYRAKQQSEKMPRIFLLVDEFHEFFTEDDQLSRHVAVILDRLVRQGRAFGIHVLLASQSLNSSYNISKSTTDQIGVRIALQCSEADSRIILGEDNAAAKGLERSGDAIYNDANGLVEGNKRFQVVFLSNDQLKNYLQEIKEYTQQVCWVSPKPQIVFDGLELARMEDNFLLKEALESAVWPKPCPAVSMWLGDPIAIKDPMSAIFRRQSRSNLLILGQNEDAAVSMLLAALVSLSVQQSPQNVVFYVVDLSNMDSVWHGRVNHLSEAFPHRVKIRRRREVLQTVQEIESLIKERSAHEGDPFGESIYLIIIGLQRAKDMRSDDPYDRTESSNQFSTVLREGPEIDVHTLLCCDTYTNLERSLDRKDIAQFDLRVVLQMSANDSNKIIDSDAASKLGPCSALFLDEDRASQPEKFRPYNFPSQNWISEVGLRMKSKVDKRQ